jgi:hypothetical protein
MKPARLGLEHESNAWGLVEQERNLARFIPDRARWAACPV